MSVRDVLCIACGGAVGAVARHGVALICVSIFGPKFPWGTLVVNVVGCFLLGWLMQASLNSEAVSESFKLTVGTGFLGALTTFSTFGVQSVQTWQWSSVLGVANVLGNVVLGLVAAVAGMVLATRLSTS